MLIVRVNESALVRPACVDSVAVLARYIDAPTQIHNPIDVGGLGRTYPIGNARSACPRVQIWIIDLQASNAAKTSVCLMQLLIPRKTS